MKDMKKAVIRQIVAQIDIKKKGSKEGEAQREAFRIRWGMRPDQL